MYTIKRAAELTGISVATLRAWERRYGVVKPRRSDGGYRLYSVDDVRTLAIMNSLVNEGWSAREAARETLDRLSSRDAGGVSGGPGPVSGEFGGGYGGAGGAGGSINDPVGGSSHGSTRGPDGSASSAGVNGSDGSNGHGRGGSANGADARNGRINGRADGRAADRGNRGSRPSGARIPRGSDAVSTTWESSDTDAFIRAATRLDASAAASVLDARFALGSFEHVVDHWLMPTLQRVGEEWAAGRMPVAGEHLTSYAVQRRLAAAYEAAASRGEGPTVLIGLPAGARHELGLMAFAVAARRAGLATIYVGADLPPDDWTEAVRARSAAAVVIAVPRLVDVAATRTIATRVRAVEPTCLVALGGRFQDSVGQGCVPLGHSITAAVDELMQRLQLLV